MSHDTVLTFGKHAGRTYRDVFANEPGYYAHFDQAKRAADPPRPPLAAFLAYCDERLRIQKTGANAFKGTKHAGRTFADVFNTEGGYADWALQLKSPFGELKEFVDYCGEMLENAEHGDGPPTQYRAVACAACGVPCRRETDFGGQYCERCQVNLMAPSSSSSSHVNQIQMAPHSGNPNASTWPGPYGGTQQQPVRTRPRLSFDSPNPGQNGGSQHTRALKPPVFDEPEDDEEPDWYAGYSDYEEEQERLRAEEAERVRQCARPQFQRFSDKMREEEAAKLRAEQEEEQRKTREEEARRAQEARREAEQAEKERKAREEEERRVRLAEEAKRLKRERAEQKEKEWMETGRQAMQEDFHERVRDYVIAIEDKIKRKNADIAAAVEEGSKKTAPGAEIHLPKGGLLKYYERSRFYVYNPLKADRKQQELPLSKEERSLIDRFEEDTFECETKLGKQLASVFDFRPEKIVDFANTFGEFSLEEWVDRRRSIEKPISLIQALFDESADSLPPDIAVAIRKCLRERYDTEYYCENFSMMFGGRILPQVRKSVGAEAYAEMTNQHRGLLCAQQYMDHRKVYDTSSQETPETTFRRDALRRVIETLLNKGLLEHDDESCDGEALYWKAGNESRILLLKSPNSGAADLFSREGLEKEATRIAADYEEDEAPESPSAEEHRGRILRLFRRLYRYVTTTDGGAPWRYGVAKGLKESDGIPRLLAGDEDTRLDHEQMLEDGWSVRDYVGFVSRKKHNNHQLVEQIFVEHLGLRASVVDRVKKAAEKAVTDANARLAKKSAAIRADVEKQTGARLGDASEMGG